MNIWRSRVAAVSVLAILAGAAHAGIETTFVHVNTVEIDSVGYNLIGGDTPGERNLISGNGTGGPDGGVTIQGPGTMSNTVSGNYVGTDASGTAAIPNSQHGVAVKDGASANYIGGASAGERNVIVNWVGVSVSDAGTTSAGITRGSRGTSS